MNRRSFFRKLIGAAIVAPVVVEAVPVGMAFLRGDLERLDPAIASPLLPTWANKSAAEILKDINTVLTQAWDPSSYQLPRELVIPAKNIAFLQAHLPARAFDSYRYRSCGPAPGAEEVDVLAGLIEGRDEDVMAVLEPKIDRELREILDCEARPSQG